MDKVGEINDYELQPRQEYLVVFLHDHKAYLDRIRVTYYILLEEHSILEEHTYRKPITQS